MGNKFNLEGIKEEMANRRNERNTVSEQLGESIPNIKAKDGFLNGLITSFNTGRETHATKRIKLIENKVDIREGRTPKFKDATNDISVNEISRNNIKINSGLEEFDRDEQMYAELNKKALKGGQTLSESLMSISGQENKNKETPNNSAETVKGLVNNYLAENFSLIVEESIKSTILEMYAVERIKEVLHENRGMIKTIMLEILKELRAKQKV